MSPFNPNLTNEKRCSNFNSYVLNYLDKNLGQGDTLIIYNYLLSHLGSYNQPDTRHGIMTHTRESIRTMDGKVSIYKSFLGQLEHLLDSKGSRALIVIPSIRIGNFEEDLWYQITRESFDEHVAEHNAERIALINSLSEFVDSSNSISLTGPDSKRICSESFRSFKECFIDPDHVSAVLAEHTWESILKSL